MHRPAHTQRKTALDTGIGAFTSHARRWHHLRNGNMTCVGKKDSLQKEKDELTALQSPAAQDAGAGDTPADEDAGDIAEDEEAEEAEHDAYHDGDHAGADHDPDITYLDSEVRLIACICIRLHADASLQDVCSAERDARGAAAPECWLTPPCTQESAMRLCAERRTRA